MEQLKLELVEEEALVEPVQLALVEVVVVREDILELVVMAGRVVLVLLEQVALLVVEVEIQVLQLNRAVEVV